MANLYSNIMVTVENIKFYKQAYIKQTLYNNMSIGS